MSDLIIDPEACHAGAAAIDELAEELDQSASNIKGEVQDKAGILDGYIVSTAHEAGQAAFRLNLRDHRRSLLFADLGQYIETNTLLIEEADAAASADMTHLEDQSVSMSAETYDQVTHSGGEYSSSEYYELTGEERPEVTGEGGAMPIGGENVAV